MPNALFLYLYKLTWTIGKIRNLQLAIICCIRLRFTRFVGNCTWKEHFDCERKIMWRTRHGFTQVSCKLPLSTDKNFANRLCGVVRCKPVEWKSSTTVSAGKNKNRIRSGFFFLPEENRVSIIQSRNSIILWVLSGYCAPSANTSSRRNEFILFAGIVYDPCPSSWRRSATQPWLCRADGERRLCRWKRERGPAQTKTTRIDIWQSTN